MSALAGALASESSAAVESTVRWLLAAQQHRGDDRLEIASANGASIGVSRFGWETAASHAGSTTVARRGANLAVADASLYDVRSLRLALEHAGVASVDYSATALVLSAYEAWGEAFVGRLNGDFAFLLWDGSRRRLLAGRDSVGRRALFSRRLGDVWVFASTATAVAELAPAALVRPLFLAAAVSGLLGGSADSAFDGVTPHPAGSLWAFGQDGSRHELWRWHPPRFRSRGRPATREDQERFRDVLGRAVADRSPDPTAVWLSGGADSTAVYACGSEHFRRQGLTNPLRPVSLSFPPGDSAREDEHILSVAGRWGSSVTWVDSEGIPLLDGLAERAETRDDPYAHTFENPNRALGKTSNLLGAHVALDGHGGDSLFQVSSAYLAELVMTGQLSAFRRVIAAHGRPGMRELLRWIVLPFFPEAVWRLVDTVRSQKLERWLQQTPASWLTQAMAREVIRSRLDRPELDRGLLEGPAAFESRWYLATPYMSRSAAWTHQFALESGIELRSPMLDPRVIQVASELPLMERAGLKDSKPFVREAMLGLIPDSVLASRAQKTGVPQGYLRRRMASEFQSHFLRVFGDGSASSVSVALADLGVIDVSRLRSAWLTYKVSSDHVTGVQLFLTLAAELWARARTRGPVLCDVRP